MKSNSDFYIDNEIIYVLYKENNNLYLLKTSIENKLLNKKETVVKITTKKTIHSILSKDNIGVLIKSFYKTEQGLFLNKYYIEKY